MKTLEKAVVLTLLMMAVACPLRGVGQYHGRTVIVTDSYVLELGNFSESAVINNKYTFSPMPQIAIDTIPLSIDISIPAGEFLSPADKYVIEGTGSSGDAEVTARIEIRDRTITTKVIVYNSGGDPHKVDLSYILSSDESMALFSPVTYRQSADTHFALLDETRQGYALGVVTTSPLQPGIPNFASIQQYGSTVSIPSLGSGGTMEFTVTYYPFNLQLTGTLPYPLELTSHMEEPLVSHEPLERQVALSQPDIYDKMRELLARIAELPKGTGEFVSIHDVDFDTDSMDSLDMSVYFKDACIQNNIPCRLVLGKSGISYYAWVQFYAGAWEDADVFSGTFIKPDFEVVYTEPQNELHTMPENTEAGVDAAIGFLSGVGQSNFLLYLVIIIIAAVVVAVVFQTRSKSILKYVKKREETAEAKESAKVVSPELEPVGEYEILKDAVEGDLFLQEVLQQIKQNNGIVDVVKYAEVLKYSKELIKFAIVYLHDQKYIKKKGEVAVVAPETPLPKFEKKKRFGFLPTLKIESKKKEEKLREVVPLKATGITIKPGEEKEEGTEKTPAAPAPPKKAEAGEGTGAETKPKKKGLFKKLKFR
jgi:hypothetical protein